MSKTRLKIGSGVCPWWLIPLFDNPLRHLFQDPEKILAGLVQPGEHVADIGCGMGYFTLALARLVGEHGRVIAVDLQPRMLAGARRRLERVGLQERVILHKGEPGSLNLDGDLDFALAFWMIHEVPDAYRLLAEIQAHLRPSASLLFVEPRLHVNRSAFESSLEIARQLGYKVEPAPTIAFSLASLLVKSSI